MSDVGAIMDGKTSYWMLDIGNISGILNKYPMPWRMVDIHPKCPKECSLNKINRYMNLVKLHKTCLGYI